MYAIQNVGLGATSISEQLTITRPVRCICVMGRCTLDVYICYSMLKTWFMSSFWNSAITSARVHHNT